jgi:hypothetical protein
MTRRAPSLRSAVTVHGDQSGSDSAPHLPRLRGDAPVCSRQGERRDSNPRPPGPTTGGPGVRWDRMRLSRAKSVRLNRLSFAQIGSSLVARSGADAHPRERRPPRQASAPRFVGKATPLSSALSPTAPFVVEKQDSQPRHLLLVPTGADRVGESAAFTRESASERHVACSICPDEPARAGSCPRVPQPRP